MASKNVSRTAGIANLVNPNGHERVMSTNSGQFRQVPQRMRATFWASYPFRRAGNWILSTFGPQSSGPVNDARSFGGVTVTPELSLMLSSVWASVGRYQKTVSTLPLHLMRTTAKNSAEPFYAHPLYRVLHDQPNSQQSAVAFWQGFIGQYMTWGVGYAVKLRIDNRVVGLKPLLSAFMTSYFDANERLRYRYTPGGGVNTEKDYAADELFVVLDRTMDGYSPLSRIQYGANSMGVAIAGERAANLAFKNGLRSSGILTIAQWLKKDQREAYRDKVNEFVGTGTGDGNDKQFGVLVAENATKFEAINIKPQDLELLESRRFSIEDICRWYDIPPILIGHASQGQTMWGSGIEQIILGWLKLGLAPVLRTVEQEIWRQLLDESDKTSGVFGEYNLEGLLRGDSAARASFYSQMLQNGVMQRSEVRARESLPYVAGSEGLTVQSNLTTLEQLRNNPGSSEAQKLRDDLRHFLGLEDGNGPQAKES